MATDFRTIVNNGHLVVLNYIRAMGPVGIDALRAHVLVQVCGADNANHRQATDAILAELGNRGLVSADGCENYTAYDNTDAEYAALPLGWLFVPASAGADDEEGERWDGMS
jgi:hypothetical protein